MANCLYLHDRYTTKFYFMNYVFAKLVVASLYLFGQRKLYILSFTMLDILCPTLLPNIYPSFFYIMDAS